MKPQKPLPYSDEFDSADSYIEELLHFATSSVLFRFLCGGVHILDFFTDEPGLFYSSFLPVEWRSYLLQVEPMVLLNVLMRDGLSSLSSSPAPLAFQGGGKEEAESHGRPPTPPESLVQYIRDIRRLALRRDFHPTSPKLPVLPRSVAMGMKVKKIHEVTHFAGFVDQLADKVASRSLRPVASSSSPPNCPDDQGHKPLSHLVDFGSGQNYLGRTLASPPYDKHVIAVESKEANIAGARDLDRLAGLVEKEKVLRNKKVYQRILDKMESPNQALKDEGAILAAAKALGLTEQELATIDLKPRRERQAGYSTDAGKGSIEYVAGRLENGELGDVVAQVRERRGRIKKGRQATKVPSEMHGQEGPHHQAWDGEDSDEDLRMMAISIHSCGNLSHHGIRSLVLNKTVRAVAVIGCCYNLLTEKLGPPTYGHDKLSAGCDDGLSRPNMVPLNNGPRARREAERRDPQGFPMSEKLSRYVLPGRPGEVGLRLNITARMMACQAPQNWTAGDSDTFFTRHFFRAVLQRLFLDRGVISQVANQGTAGPSASGPAPTPPDTGCWDGCSLPPGQQEEAANSNADNATDTATNKNGRKSTCPRTNSVILGSLRKHCYRSFAAYVRGAVAKLTDASSEYHDAETGQVVAARMGDITDTELGEYEARFASRKRELSAVWSLMAFSATVVESIIVADRWLFLREHMDGDGDRKKGLLSDCWVETVFDYATSPRNLVVVGIKREDA